MNETLLKSYLKELKLSTMVQEYKSAVKFTTGDNGSYTDFLGYLAEREVQERRSRATERKLKEAKFPVERDLAEFKWESTPSISRQQIIELAKGEYIKAKEPVVFLGPPGVGKTHLAIALGREACRLGYRVAFYTASGLATIYAEAREDKELRALQRTIERRNLIIIAELGYVPLQLGAAQNLFDFFSQCYERTSVIVTTNLPFSSWPEVFGDERLTGALLDRLTHKVHAFSIEGESYRLKSRRKKKGGQSKKSTNKK
jgi:DNA replication protein DnaC